MRTQHVVAVAQRHIERQIGHLQAFKLKRCCMWEFGIETLA